MVVIFENLNVMYYHKKYGISFVILYIFKFLNKFCAHKSQNKFNIEANNILVK